MGARRAFIVGGAAGATAMYLLDPQLGRTRRARLRDQALARLRRTERRAEHVARYAQGRAVGAVHRATHPLPSELEPDDRTLAHRIESELFRSRDFPKGDINIEVVDGVVTLRGQVQTPDVIRRIVATVEDMPGVRGVESFLHLPGTPAPNKAAAREAG